MALTSAMIDAMLASGCTAEQIAAVVKADMAEAELRKEAKRENNAERQRRFREKRASRKSNAGNALRGVTPPIDNTHTPGDISPDGENHSERVKVDPFPKPDWVEDDQVWIDFLANPKRKKAPRTATAYRRFLSEIAKFSDDEWPPGRLLEHAAAKGWAGIYDPREQRNDRPSASNDEIQNPYVRAALARQGAEASPEWG